MFWKFDLHPNSSLDTILSKDDCTLPEILDEDDVLQECKSQNRKLLDFLVKPDVLDELVGMITKEPADDLDEKLRYKYPNIACELLISDVQIILDQLTADDTLLNKLWAFLECDSSLNPLLASFFSKVISLLISRKTDMVLEFLKSKENAVDCILCHIDTSAIMDLVVRLATNVEVTEQRYELLHWLNEQKLMEKLVDLVDPQHSSDKICNASQALCDLIKCSRDYMSQLQENASPDPLLSTIENKGTLTILLDHMLHEVHLNSSSDALVAGVGVLLTLLEVNKTNSESPFANVELGEPVTALDAERLAHGVTTTLSALVPRLEGFHKILTDPPPMSVMITTVGKLDPPLGKTRLQVMKLISAVLTTKSQEAYEELAKLSTLDVIWDLFFRYPWNNFLHSEVEHCINTILSDSPVEDGDEGEHLLLIALMKNLNIIQKIADIFSYQEKCKDDGWPKRYGYMGHLTKIANDVYQGLEKGRNYEKMTALYNDLEQEVKDAWEQFVSGKLAVINKRNMTDLAGRHPLHSSDDEDDEYRPVSFLRNGNIGSYQQTFTHYQMQHMAPEFLDSIGFDEEQFPESDEQMNAPFDLIADVNFSIDTNEDNPNSAMFEAACNERIHAFDDNDSDEEDVWPSKEISFSSAVELRSSLSEESESSESEEEEVEGRDEKISVKKQDSEITGEEDFSNLRTSSPFVKKEPSEENKMDVDHSEVWTAHFEAPSTLPEPAVSMDIQAAADPSSVGWNTEAVAASNDVVENKGWAKFDDLSTIAHLPSPITAVGAMPRASSPVAMDTEASSPNPGVSSAYVVDCDEAEMTDDLAKFSDVFTDNNDDDKQPEATESSAAVASDLAQDRLVGPTGDDDTDKTTNSSSSDVASGQQEEDASSSNNEDNNTTVKTNGAPPEQTESNEETANPNCSTAAAAAAASTAACSEGTLEQSEENTTCETNTDNSSRSSNNTVAEERQDQQNTTESGTQEKIPVSARNGPSLS